MDKVTVTLHTDDPSPVMKMWIVRNAAGEYVGFIRKFKDTKHDTSPFQVFTSPTDIGVTGKIIAEFWAKHVDLNGMNRAKHHFGGFREASKFAREYFGNKVDNLIVN